MIYHEVGHVNISLLSYEVEMKNLLHLVVHEAG